MAFVKFLYKGKMNSANISDARFISQDHVEFSLTDYSSKKYNCDSLVLNVKNKSVPIAINTVKKEREKNALKMVDILVDKIIKLGG